MKPRRFTKKAVHILTECVLLFGEPSGIRTPDTLIKSQVLCQLS